MGFMQRGGWNVYFMLPDLKTHLPRKLTFSDSDKVAEIAKRGGMAAGLKARAALEHGLAIGRGGCWLQLTDAQYDRLK
jgi:hypothetical protein